MLNTVIYISNQELIGMNVVKKQKRTTASGIFRMKIPEGCVLNGFVVEEDVLLDLIEAFWKTYPLSRTKVTLLIGSGQAASKVIWVPAMSHEKMMRYLPREFLIVERAKQQVYSYLELSKKGKMRQILATMADSSVLMPHIKRFQSQGIHLTTIVAAGVAELQLLLNLPYLKNQTCMVQILEGTSLLNVVLRNGDFFHLNRIRLFDQPGTAAFYASCAREIVSQQQNLKEHHGDGEIRSLYLAGDWKEQDLAKLQQRVRMLDSVIVVETLPVEGNQVLNLDSMAAVDLKNLPMLLGTILIRKESANLYRQYCRNSKQEQAARRWLSYLTPLLVTAGLGMVIVLGEIGVWIFQFEQLKKQQAFMENAGLNSIVMEYERESKQSLAIWERIRATEKTQENRNSYPAYSMEIKRLIEECKTGDTQVKIVSFDSVPGTVTLTGSSDREEGISAFVRQLEESTGVFAFIDYQGYVYNQEENRWETTLVCHLLARGKTEGIDGMGNNRPG